MAKKSQHCQLIMTHPPHPSSHRNITAGRDDHTMHKCTKQATKARDIRNIPTLAQGGLPVMLSEVLTT